MISLRLEKEIRDAEAAVEAAGCPVGDGVSVVPVDLVLWLFELRQRRAELAKVTLAAVEASEGRRVGGTLKLEHQKPNTLKREQHTDESCGGCVEFKGVNRVEGESLMNALFGSFPWASGDVLKGKQQAAGGVL